MAHPLSYTRARTFDECPFKFKIEYLDQLRTPPEPYLITGSILHECADRYVKFLKEWKKSSEFSAMDRIAKEVWSEPEHRRGLSEEHWDEVLELCVQAREMLVFEDPNVVAGSELKLAVDICGRPCGYDSPEATIRGKIDRLDIFPGGSEAVVLDYKSGRKMDGLEGNKQLATYAMLAKAHYPSITEIEASLVYVRYGITKRGLVPQVELDRISEWYPNIQRGIDWCMKSKAWPARPGYACRGCAAFKFCPERGRGIRLTPPQNEQEAVGMVERLILLDRERNEINEAMRPWIDQYGNLDVNGMTMGLFVSQRLEFNPVKAWTILQDRGFQPMNYMKVDNTAIKKLGRKDKGLAAALESIARDRSTTNLKLKSTGEDE